MPTKLFHNSTLAKNVENSLPTMQILTSFNIVTHAMKYN